MENDDDFLDYSDDYDESLDQNIEFNSPEITQQQAKELAQKKLLARKRIDEIMEKKRLKELFDDENDW